MLFVHDKKRNERKIAKVVITKSQLKYFERIFGNCDHPVVILITDFKCLKTVMYQNSKK